MSQDGELVHELVTTKYKIAEKNRIAKYRFLNKAERKKSSVVISRRGSEPTMEVPKIDYSVPGTPISSRNINELRKNYKNIESDSEDDEGHLDNDQQIPKILNSLVLEETLRKFTADMEELQRQVVTMTVNESHDEVKTLDKYFVESDKKNTYRREFSDVAGTIDFGPKPSNKAKVDEYFQESIRLNSFQREFPMETFDPQINKFYNLSIPGTPISSRFISQPSKHQLIDTSESEASNESIDGESEDSEVEEDDGDGDESDGNLSIVTLKNSHEAINVESLSPPPIAPPPKQQPVCEIIIKDEKVLKLNITVPGTPVSSRRESTISTGTCSLADDCSSTDDYNIQVKQLANECVNVIEDLLQKVLQDDQQQSPEVLNTIKIGNEISEAEAEETTTDAINNKNIIISTSSSTEQHMDAPTISLELLNSKKEEDEEVEKEEVKSSENYENIQNYLKKSSLENSYQRTFSEVEKFNEPLPGAKLKIEKYFQESEQKMTFQRPFSEVFSYLVNVEPTINLTIPGTPISSHQIMSLKSQTPQPDVTDSNEKQQSEPFSANDYFTESLNRNTFQRSFSETVDQLGQPIVINNPEINNYFTFSDQQKSYQRTFSEAIQEMPSRIEDILLEQPKKVVVKLSGNGTDVVEKQRTLSVCSNQSNNTSSQLYGKKYGIDKYFATSLYRTAYHRSTTSRRQSTDDDNNNNHNDDLTDELGADNTLSIFEPDRDGHEQSVELKVRQQQFWKDFMKPSI